MLEKKIKEKKNRYVTMCLYITKYYINKTKSTFFFFLIEHYKGIIVNLNDILSSILLPF